MAREPELVNRIGTLYEKVPKFMIKDENGEWKVTRRLNGDEAALMTFFEPTVLKVKVFTYV